MRRPCGGLAAEGIRTSWLQRAGAAGGRPGVRNRHGHQTAQPAAPSSHLLNGTARRPRAHPALPPVPRHPAPRPSPGLSQLPNARKFNLGKYPKGSLRQRFPPAGLGFDGRPPLSEQGFHLLSSLLELCPVRRAGWFSSRAVCSGSPRCRPSHRPCCALLLLSRLMLRPAQACCLRAPAYLLPPLRLLPAHAARPRCTKHVSLGLTARLTARLTAVPSPQERRISCEEALDHPWFREQPLPKDRALMPTFPATNDTTQKSTRRSAARRRRRPARRPDDGRRGGGADGGVI